MLAMDMTLIWSRSFLVYHVIIFEFTELFDFLKWWSEIQSFKSYLKRNICVKSVQIRGFFWSVFSRIRTEYGEMRKNSVFGHFSRTESLSVKHGAFGTKYSRMDQVKFFKGCLSQISLSPFLNTLPHLLCKMISGVNVKNNP